MNNSRAYFIATLIYEPLSVSEETILKLNAEGDSAIENTEITLADSTTVSTESTGEKEIGEKAKGKIRIFNATSEIVVLKKGEVAECIVNFCDGLTYTLNSEVNIGPQSPEEVDITASDAGENYNLNAGDGRFKIGDYSSQTDLVSTNIQALEGGTPKKKVKFVSKQDLETAQKKAEEELEERILFKIKNTPTNSNFHFIDETYSYETISTDADASEDDEVDIINVTIEGEGKVTAFDKTEIDKQANEYLNSLIPDGYKLQAEANPTWTIQEQTATIVTVKIQVNLNMVPAFNVQDIKKTLAGTNIDDVDKKISSIDKVVSHRRTLTPDSNLPNFLRNVPESTSKIEIRLEAKQASEEEEISE